MIVVQINISSGIGSTGKICDSISTLLDKNHIENYILCVNKLNNQNAISYMSNMEVKKNSIKSRLLGNYGFNSKKETRRLISFLERIKPDIIHLHNLHTHNCNLEMLFDYIKKNKIKIVWTFHDCWAFTGYCTHFDMISCEKWQSGCHKCPQKKKYSISVDRSNFLFRKKKKVFQDVDMMIVTPSKWLGYLVNNSFFKDYPSCVINNGINLNIFKPTKSDFRSKYNCNKKFIILGVSFNWGRSKGLDIFINLAKELTDEYQIILVGTQPAVDKILPKNIISIHKTENQEELAKIYTVADLFVNPTREDTYPTVNMEALACGTPIVTFETGGSPEILSEKTGIVVAKNDEEGLKKAIYKVKEERPFDRKECVKSAEKYNQNLCWKSYFTLYQEIINTDDEEKIYYV